MATKEEVMKAALEVHNVGAIDDPNNSMVYLLFGDGELCLTKCGSLFGQRSLHMIAPAKVSGEGYDFPFSFNGYKCIVLADHDKANHVREMM